MTAIQYRVLRLSILITALPAMVMAASVYETQADFLSRAFGRSPPEPALLWLSGERKSAVGQLLGHDYSALRLRYWCRDSRSAWVLDEIGKDLPITVGVVVEESYIKSLRVLTYRENRGGEVVVPAFTDQFDGAQLQEDDTLSTTIDGISGATLSVQALTRLAAVALYLHADSGCSDDA
jgi:hypothetical protein